MKNLILELNRIKEVMGLLVEQPTGEIARMFNFDKMFSRLPENDDAVIRLGLKDGSTDILTKVDFDNAYLRVSTKTLDQLDSADKSFLKNLNSKILNTVDIIKLADDLKADFKTIQGDDLAVRKFLDDMEDILPERYNQTFVDNITPNPYLALTTAQLKKDWLIRKPKLQKNAPTRDDVEFLNGACERRVISDYEYATSMKEAPGFKETWNLYSTFLNKKRNIEGKQAKGDFTWEKYLESESEKLPELKGKSALVSRFLAAPSINFVTGLIEGNFKLAGLGALGLVGETTLVTGTAWEALKLIYNSIIGGKKTLEAINTFVEEYTGVSDDEMKNRWENYWNGKNPLVEVSGNSESIFKDGKNANYFKNPPSFERLGKTNNLKLLSNKTIKIGDTDYNVIEFKLSTVPVAAGSNIFPDVIKAIKETPTPSTTTYIDSLEDNGGQKGFKSYVEVELKGDKNTAKYDSERGFYTFNNKDYSFKNGKFEEQKD